MPLAERPHDGLPVATRAIAVARATRQDRVVPMLASVRSMLNEHLLALDDSLQDAETAAESARLLGHASQLHQALITQANIHWLRGDRADAARLRNECAEIAARLEPTTSTITGLANAAAQFVDEDPERCIREMTAAGGPLLERADLSWGTWLLGVLVRAALKLGRADDAERTGLRLDAIGARMCAGRALGAAGERDAAIAMLQRVAADAARGSAGLFVEEASRELRRLGSRISATSRRAGAPAGDDALSEREREIADLVAEGRTNKQVAATLFLSEKTIEHNLSRIYAKLGVRSRVELAGRGGR